MLNVTEQTKSAYLGDSTHKVLTLTFPDVNVTITNDDIVGESAELTEAIENETNLTFKGCISSQLKFQVANIVRDLRGQYVEAKIQAANTEEISLFKGYVDTQDNQTQEDILTTITAYDALYKVGDKNMQSWVDTLTFPMTVKEFRDSLFLALEITQESATLINDSLSISASVKEFLENPSARVLLQWICQLNGRFGQIGRDGVFHYRKLKEIIKGLYPSETTYPSPTTYPSQENADLFIYRTFYSDIEYEPYRVEGIDKVSIYDSEGINQGNYGTGTNILSISDNSLAFSVNMAQAAANLYGEVHGLWYNAIVQVNCVGAPWIECGDVFMSSTQKNIVRSYVLNRTLKGIQALFDTYTSDSDRTQPEVKATATSRINANRQSVLQIQADIVEMNTVIAQKATIEQLNATNARVGTVEAGLVSANQVIATKATIDSLNAVSARVGTLEADHVSVASLNAVSARVGTLEADHVSVASMNAANANISNLSGQVANLNTVVANKIDATTVQANYMEVANWTSAGVIKADKISADTFSGRNVSASSFTASRFYNGGDPYGGGSITFVTGVDFTNKTVSTSTVKVLKSQ